MKWRLLWAGPMAFLALLLVSSAPTEAGPGKLLEKFVDGVVVSVGAPGSQMKVK